MRSESLKKAQKKYMKNKKQIKITVDPETAELIKKAAAYMNEPITEYILKELQPGLEELQRRWKALKRSETLEQLQLELWEQGLDPEPEELETMLD